jgi:hypothetical protein
VSFFNNLGKKSGGNGDQSGITFQEALKQVNEHPEECYRAAGFKVPKEIMGNQQATVMHLIQSGQVGGQAMQRIQPMLNMLMGRR